MTIIPKQKSPTSGLVLAMGVWKAWYHRDGKRYYKGLATADKDIALVRKKVFYDALLAEGAKEVAPKCIAYRKPYVVRVEGVHVGDFATREEAEAALTAYHEAV